MTGHLLRALIPRAWTGEEALRAAFLLQQALHVLWEMHGERMAEALMERPMESWDDYLGDDPFEEDLDPQQPA